MASFNVGKHGWKVVAGIALYYNFIDIIIMLGD